MSMVHPSNEGHVLKDIIEELHKSVGCYLTRFFDRWMIAVQSSKRVAELVTAITVAVGVIKSHPVPAKILDVE